MHEAKIRRCPLFGDVHKKFVAAIATVVAPEVYLPSEFIVVAVRHLCSNPRLQHAQAREMRAAVAGIALWC